jgi:uncharacterized membrane protein (DUF2068 family)
LKKYKLCASAIFFPWNIFSLTNCPGRSSVICSKLNFQYFSVLLALSYVIFVFSAIISRQKWL